MVDYKVKLSHGDGGNKTSELIRKIFLRNYSNEYKDLINDSFVFKPGSENYAFTTDSFVVSPLFFRGGDIGKLSVCGTINDLAAAGAVPLYISAGFIIEEGFDLKDLEIIAQSMGNICRDCGVNIVTGDTKVVEKGHVNGLYINTSGIGIVSKHYNPSPIESQDEIIVTGTIGDHATAILIDRYELDVQSDFKSDCCALSGLVTGLSKQLEHVKLMKDPTRGGLATILNEIAKSCNKSIEILESSIPINEHVKGINSLLGIDPLYLACEGRMVLVVKKEHSGELLERLKTLKEGKGAKLIGHITDEKLGAVFMNTSIGGKRIVPALEGQTIPRIC
ncbi:MAG TPA: hydrogenase expression/formation protein HypE [Clostridia bacterium]|nr:hydrogenase expression/formation protein HypE [Clostridia bacterium]